MGEIIRFPARQKHRADKYFGGCPYCGGLDGMIDAGPVSWCVCQAHRVRWSIGPNVAYDPDSWIYRIKRLRELREVTPIFPDEDHRA